MFPVLARGAAGARSNTHGSSAALEDWKKPFKAPVEGRSVREEVGNIKKS